LAIDTSRLAPVVQAVAEAAPAQTDAQKAQSAQQPQVRYKGDEVSAGTRGSPVAAAKALLMPGSDVSLARRAVQQGGATSLDAAARAREAELKELRAELPDLPDAERMEAFLEELGELVGEQVGAKAAEEDIALYDGLEESEKREAVEGGSEAPEGEIGGVGRDNERNGGTGSGDRGGGEAGEHQQPDVEEGVHKALSKFDSDPTHQFAALEFARGNLEKTGANPKLLAALDAVTREYESSPELMQSIRAGQAVALEAHDFAAALGNDPAIVQYAAHEMRDAYRQMLRKDPNLGRLFDVIRKIGAVSRDGQSQGEQDRNQQSQQSHDEQRFMRALDSFMSAAGQDLHSSGPSIDPAFLHLLLVELAKLKNMRTVLVGIRDLIEETDRLAAPSDRGKMRTVELTRSLLYFCAKTVVNLNDARELLGPLQKNAQPASQVAYGNAFSGIHALIPPSVVPGPAFQQQHAILGTMLRQFAEKEEQAYGAVAAGKPPPPASLAQLS
jgi:hypothetical protein